MQFLLGVYPWSSTYEEREAIQHQNTSKYSEYNDEFTRRQFSLTTTEKESITLIAKVRFPLILRYP